MGRLADRLVLLAVDLAIGPGRGGVTTRGEAVAEGGEEAARGLGLNPKVLTLGVGGTIPMTEGEIASG